MSWATSGSALPQQTKKPAAKPWQRVPGIADVAFIIAYISHQTTQPPTLTPHQDQAALILQLL
jgi:hypothetical protein